MNPFAVPSLVSACSCGALAVLLHLRGSRSRSARIFSVLLMLMTAEAVLEYAYRISTSAAQAQLCWQLNFHWPLILATVLHFTLVVLRDRAGGVPPLHLVVIYGPALVFVLAEASAHLITGPPVLAWWGWTYGPPATDLVRNVAYGWVLVVTISATALMIGAWRKAVDRNARVQFGFIAIGFGVMALGAPLEVVFSIGGISVPPLSVSCYALAVFPIGFGVLRHDLFRMSPAVAADGIIAALQHPLFLVAPDGTIRFANPGAARVLGCPEVDLVNRRLAAVFTDAPRWVRELDAGKLDVPAELRDVEATLRCRSGERVPVLLSGAPVLNANGQLRGVVVIGHDISELKEAAAEIEQYRDHLEALVRERTQDIRAAYDRLEEEMAEHRLARDECSSLQERLLESERRLAGERDADSDRP